MTAVDAHPIHGAGPKSRRLRRAIVIVAIVGAFAATFGAWLAGTGGTSAPISTPPGTPASGNVADVTPLTNSSVTQSNGAAQVQAGIGIAQIVTSSLTANHLKFNVVWSNAATATAILQNKGVISMGVYHPVHQGNCNKTTGQTNGADGGDQTVESVVSVAVDSTHTYCMVLDESSTGPLVSGVGKLLLDTAHSNGFLAPQGDESAAASVCPTVGVYGSGQESLTDPPCLPVDISTQSNVSSTQRALYLVASVETSSSHGNVPPGQQGGLNFTVRAVHNNAS